jgi:hypothetical protein
MKRTLRCQSLLCILPMGVLLSAGCAGDMDPDEDPVADEAVGEEEQELSAEELTHELAAVSDEDIISVVETIEGSVRVCNDHPRQRLTNVTWSVGGDIDFPQDGNLGTIRAGECEESETFTLWNTDPDITTCTGRVTKPFTIHATGTLRAGRPNERTVEDSEVVSRCAPCLELCAVNCEIPGDTCAGRYDPFGCF